MISIVNYGMGNLGSIRNMLMHLGYENNIIDSPSDVSQATKLILPGVGSFDSAVKNLHKSRLWEALRESVEAKNTPILGICLGMQLLTRSSEEGTLPGFGWIDAEVRKFPVSVEGQKLTLPHMGWRNVSWADHRDDLRPQDSSPRFYFVHSYYVSCSRSEDVLATARYGIDFVAAVAKDHIRGTQFHPEKSHRFGKQLLARFAQLG